MPFNVLQLSKHENVELSAPGVFIMITHSATMFEVLKTEFTILKKKKP